MRKFEMVRPEFIKYGVDPKTLKKPFRATKYSVCYDCFAPIDIRLEPQETKLVFINFKAYFGKDEGMFTATTSGLGKRGICLANGVGIIESDYADNPDNDGNIGFLLHNLNKTPFEFKAGDKIGQIFFIKYLTVDDEVEPTEIRKGGFGSTTTSKK